MGKILKYAFRITHIDNIPHILKFGLYWLILQCVMKNLSVSEIRR